MDEYVMRTVEEYIETKWKEDIDDKGYAMPGKSCVKQWLEEYAKLVIDECAEWVESSTNNEKVVNKVKSVKNIL
jgi:predicted class III extradiol MEMO1 family dioxygenase